MPCRRASRGLNRHSLFMAVVDGLDVYRRLIPQAATCLVQGGALGLEIGYDQAREVSAFLLEQGFSDIRIFEDMEHRPRVAVGVWRDVR